VGRLVVITLASTLAALAGGRGLAAAADERLVAAAADEHLWFVLEEAGPPARLVLCHHDVAMAGAYAETVLALPRRPAALAAWGRSAWLVFDPPAGSARTSREVCTVAAPPLAPAARAAPASRERLEVLAPLPGAGRLAGFVGTSGGPLALLVPERTPGDRAPPRLVRLRRGTWEELAVPEWLAGDGTFHLAAGGRDGTRPHLLAGPPMGPATPRPVAWRLAIGDGSGGWTTMPAPVAGDRVRSLVRVGDQMVAVLRRPDDAIGLRYVRAGGALELATLPRPPAPWAVLGLADGPRIVSGTRPAGPTMQRVDRLTGAAGPAVRVEPPPIDVMERLRLPAMIAVAVVAFTAVLVFRPGRPTTLRLPPGRAPLPASARLCAFAVDLVPGGIMTMVLLGCRPTDLLGIPLLTVTFQQSVPYIVMAGFTMLHSTVTECFGRPSLGKAILGARIVTVDGATPRAAQILPRNLVKTVLVLVPPLAVIMLLNPNGQGLHDLAVRTVVVGPSERGDESGPRDR
jgi:uncharacterized RDD family membrane protein YckC